jgi:hypothetical protein
VTEPWTFLTGAYADALGLEVIPLRVSRNCGVRFWPDGGTLPSAGPSPYRMGVQFEGRYYEQDAPGWRLLNA